MKITLSILFILFSFSSFSQNDGNTFEVNTKTEIVNSTLGGEYIQTTRKTPVIQEHLILIKEMDKGDYILLEINKDDKKDYSLELMNEKGDIVITISDFNSASFKIMKNYLEQGEYTVFLTDQTSSKTDIGVVTY